MPSNGVAVSAPSVALALSGRRCESAANDNARRTVTSGNGVEFARSLHRLINFIPRFYTDCQGSRKQPAFSFRQNRRGARGCNVSVTSTSGCEGPVRY
jgi:hypothetical protein